MKGESEREALAAEFDRHRLEEGEILERYHTLSERLGEGPLALLVNQIATEEEMHHFLLGTLSEWLRAPVSPDEALAAGGVDREALLRETRLLRDHEKKTIEACRGLEAKLSGAEGTLFDTILEAIAADSEKHQRLLETVEKLAQPGS